MFSELMRDVLAEDWEVDCGFRTKWSSTGEVILILALLLFITYLASLRFPFYPRRRFGDQWIFSPDFWKHSKCPTFSTCTQTGLLSPAGVITALAVAVGLLAVALLFSIGVAIHRRKAHYSREV